MNTTIDKVIKEVEKEVIEWRRYFHMYPELSFKEEKTADFVYEKLEGFGGLELTRPTKTSVMARLVYKNPGKTIAIRADMDALPIQELNDFEFTSKNEGVMHACGHDGHTAILLGTAKVLTQLKDEGVGEVRFIFQHAEELHPGGAQEMVKAGVMEGVDQVIGLHLASPIPVNYLAMGSGAVTANSDVFHLTIIGKGGHASDPSKTVDPIVIGAEVVSNLQHIISRKIGINEKAILSVTKFNGGTANNVIPNTVKLTGSVRTIDENTRKLLPKLIENIISGITAAHEASYELSYNYGYSAVVNNDEITKSMEKIAEQIFEKNKMLTIQPGDLMGSEDFSAFSNEVPGCFVFLGAGNQKNGIVHPHHHPLFTVDEDSLIQGVELFVKTALELNKTVF